MILAEIGMALVKADRRTNFGRHLHSLYRGLRGRALPNLQKQRLAIALPVLSLST